jgi:hypothetical protein
MKEYLYLVEYGKYKSYKVYYENHVFVGEFIIKEDGFYDFWPEHPSKGGYWSSYILREIADKLDKLNAPYEKDLDEYFAKNNGE